MVIRVRAKMVTHLVMMMKEYLSSASVSINSNILNHVKYAYGVLKVIHAHSLSYIIPPPLSAEYDSYHREV